MVCVGAFCHVVFKASPAGAWTVVIAFSFCAYYIGITLRSYYDSTTIMQWWDAKTRPHDTIENSSAREVAHALQQGSQASHQTTHPRSGWTALQRRWHRRRRRGRRDVRSRPDQWRLLRPLRV